MNAQELKKYIIKNNYQKNILIYCDCHSIKKSKNWLRCSLKSKNNNAIGLNLKSLKIKDFSNSDLNGDLFSFIMNIKNISFAETIKEIHNLFNLKYEKYNKKVKNIKKNNDPLSFFKKIRKKSNNNIEIEDLKEYQNNIFDNYIPLLYKDWAKIITERTRKKFNIGFSPKKERIIIPHTHYEKGYMCGVIGRTVNELYDKLNIAKYYPIIPYKKSNNLYGLYENYAEIQKAGYVTVFEGEKAVLMRHTRLDSTCVSIGCNEISEQQIKILKSLNVEIVIAFDNDISLYQILKNCEKFYPLYNVSFIKDRWNILDKKDSPADANLKNYKKLFDRRIFYNDKIHKKFIEMKKRRRV